MEQSLQHLLENSQKAYQNWKRVSFADRQKYFAQLSKILLSKKEELGKIITTEMHKPISQSIAEIEKCAGMCDFYANCENVLATQKIPSEYGISEIHFESMGIILGVMPWNYPFWQALRFAVPTILAGNVVALKHASICSNSASKMEELFLEAGFPKLIFTHYEISHSEVEEILGNPVIKGVSLTGSEEAGRKIAEIAGRNLKKSVLELGGNDAFIVCEDANIEEAAKKAALGRLQNNGQTCVAAKRFIIHSTIWAEFLPNFLEEYQKYQPKNPMDSTTVFSKMSREDLAQDLENQYQKALENGAEIILPLEKIAESTFKPGILMMNENNPINDEELFGPLAMVFVADSDEALLAKANSTKFGLGNSVWTTSADRAQFFIENLESGMVAVNQITKSDARFPFGGTKNSGYGVELSTMALHEFTTTKTVLGKI